MANLTTLDSMQYLFDPAAIAAIADRDELTGAVATVVYGLAPQGLKATESVDALLRRLGLASAFAKLTRPDGSSILIHGGSVSVVRPPVSGEPADGVRSVIFAGSFTQRVREPLDEVREAINRAGGRL